MDETYQRPHITPEMRALKITERLKAIARQKAKQRSSYGIYEEIARELTLAIYHARDDLLDIMVKEFEKIFEESTLWTPEGQGLRDEKLKAFFEALKDVRRYPFYPGPGCPYCGDLLSGHEHVLDVTDEGDSLGHFSFICERAPQEGLRIIAAMRGDS